MIMMQVTNKFLGMQAFFILVSLVAVSTHPAISLDFGTIGELIDHAGVLPDPGYDAFDQYESINEYRQPDLARHKVLTCDSELLHCVPKLDCEDDPLKGTRQCPPLWQKIGGACYFVPNTKMVRLRSQPDARQYCKDLGGLLVWFEEEYERKAVEEALNKVPFWTDGVYNKKKDHWYWENNWLEVFFKKLDGNFSSVNEEINDPSDQRLCLAVNETGFTPSTCYEQKNFVCKMGKYENRCEKALGRCCWGPSYFYYYKNLHGSGYSSNIGFYSNIESATTGDCFVLFNGDLIKCETVYKELGNIANFRVGKSIYYLNKADEGCTGSREAVISDEDVHLTIARFLMTIEKLNINIKIGLVIKATDTGSKLLWVNGKPVSYYKNTYWAEGHPKMHGLSGCVMYTGTGKDGSGSYLWHTIDDDEWCTDSKHFVLCELSIRNTDDKHKKKQGCGIRQSSGVMARSYSHGNDYEEARFGEWPWQAAILKTRNYHLGVGQEFICSGVLLAHDVVLTSAHCVKGLSIGALLVSLGDYDLEAVNQRKLLEPLSIEVQDVTLHPDYYYGKNDLAILELAKSVDYQDFPHINVGCLPSHRILYSGGDWECFVTGWPYAHHDYHGSHRRMQSVEVEFVAKRLCQKHTRDQYDSYGRHNPYHTERNTYGKKEPDLLCVQPWESTTCLADLTSLLVCKKNGVYNDDPFNIGDAEDFGSYGSLSEHPGYYNHQGSSQSYRYESTKIINAYGKNRFNAEKWYIIGVGHESNSCSTSGYMVFTPVHEYLSFINAFDVDSEIDDVCTL